MMELTPTPLTPLLLQIFSVCPDLCASFAVAQYPVCHVTNYPALVSVLVSCHPVTSALQSRFQHVHLTLMSVCLCLSHCSVPPLVCG